jgi:hypothetical protein
MPNKESFVRRAAHAAGVLLAAVVLFAAKPAAASPAVSLRLAITDLLDTYREEYPQGREFLERLDRLEPAHLNSATPSSPSDLAALAALQREALLAHPLLRRHPILFVVRHQYRPDHHNTATFFPSARREYNDGAFTPGGALKILDLARSGQVTTLLGVADGVIRDPEVHFDGDKVVFAMRRNVADSYHLYEIETNGAGLKQLTFARDVDDFDPLYLPDGGIVFSSTREPKYCMCNRHIMANLFRMEAGGANIHQIGKSTLFEGHASLMPDGRILYDRWEYVDRNFGDAQALWTVNPDGTGHALYWGNYTASPGGVIDARIVPGTELALCVFGSCHDRPWGALALIDRRLALDGPAAVLRIWPADAMQLVQQSGWELFDRFVQLKVKYEDPWPLCEKFFLCSRMTGQGEQMGIYLLDVFGNEILVHAEEPGCFDPMPLGPRPRPPVIPTRRDYASAEGHFYVQDVYQGAAMAGVKRGAVKWLRVVETPEKRYWTMPVWEGQGIEGPAMNWHDFNNKRILGTVPVAVDGSAYFSVPAERFVYFQLLDENRMMIQSMRSGTLVQPGEVAGCIGCHDDRRTAPPVAAFDLGAPAQLGGWFGPPREFNYLAEVQPVFDRHCASCHNFGGPAAEKLNLAPDRDLVFNTSYNELWRKKFLQVVGAGPAEAQPAYAWGSHASKLGRTLLERYREKLTPEEFERVVTWIDLNAPYYPSYASAYPEHLAGRSPLDNRQLARLEELTGVPLRRLSGHHTNRGPQISFDRPELSPCLAGLPDLADPRRAEALSLIHAGAAQLALRPEADAPGFVPCEVDQWREEKYRARQQAEQRNREALRAGQQHFEASDRELLP